MIILNRRGLPLLAPLCALVLSALPPAGALPAAGTHAVPAAPAATRPREKALPPRSFVPAPLLAARAAMARAQAPALSAARAALGHPPRSFAPAPLRMGQGGTARLTPALPSTTHTTRVAAPPPGFVPAALRSARPNVPATEPGGANATAISDTARIRRRIAALPLSFEANTGQANPTVAYLAHGGGYTLFLTAAGAVLDFVQPHGRGRGQGRGRDDLNGPAATDPVTATESVLDLRYVGANGQPAIAGLDELPGRANYFVGRDPGQWHTDIPTYGRVAYSDVYPGIDLAYYGTQGRLEYDWTIKPGADPGAITLAVTGTERTRIDSRGNLVLETAAGTLRELAPVAYQEIGGQRRAVDARYTLDAAGQVGFAVGGYDHSQPLTIDPVLSYSTYLGGVRGVYSDFSDAAAIAVDGQGNAYVTGATSSTSFPTTTGAYSRTLGNGAGVEDAYVTELTPNGAIGYSAYLGGNGKDEGNAIAVDGAGAVYVAGDTQSANFSTTPNAYSGALGANGTCHNADGKARNCSDAFVAVISATQSGAASLLYSTYLGGAADDYAQAVAVNATQNTGYVYVTGGTASSNFPTANALQGALGGAKAAFVTKLNVKASGAASLLYSTYLGGNGSDEGRGIAIDTSSASVEQAYVTGVTSSSNFPTTANGLQPARPPCGAQSCKHAFVTKLNPSASGSGSLPYSTYLGGNGDDYGNAIAVDGKGNAYIAGDTTSSNLPTTPNAYSRTYNAATNCPDVTTGTLTHACTDAFVVELGAAVAPDARTSAPVYGTYLGGGADDRAYGIALDGYSYVYVTGGTSASDFPISNPLQAQGGYDGSKFNNNASGATSACAGMALNNSGTTYTYPCPDAFAAQLDTSAMDGAPSLQSSTYLGGSKADDALGIAVDKDHNAWITGGSFSSDFPTTTNRLASTDTVSSTAYVAELSYAFTGPAKLRAPLRNGAGRHGKPCGCPSSQPANGEPFNTRTGSLWTTAPTLADPLPGPALAWTPSYVSQGIDAINNGMGPGWQEPYATSLTTAGQVAIVTTGEGNEESFTYAGNGQFMPYPGVNSTLVQAGGTYTETLQSGGRITFNAAGQAQTMVDPQGRRLQLTYNAQGQLTQVADAANPGRSLALSYQNGLVVGVANALGQTLAYTYTNGDLTQASDVMGHVTTYRYQSHLLVEEDNALGQPIQRTAYDTYTAQGRVISQTLQDGEQLAVSYVPTMTTILDSRADGRQDTEQVMYDQTLNTMTAVYKNGLLTQGEQVDANFNPAVALDGDSNATTTTFNGQGLPLTMTDALSGTMSAVYDGLNNPITVTDQLGRQTLNAYDSHNNLVRQTTGVTTGSPGLTTVYTYNVDLAPDPYPGQDLLVERRSPDGVVTHNGYDQTSGQLITTTVGYGAAQALTTTYGYDALGHVTKTTTGVGTASPRGDVTIYNQDDTISATIQNYQGYNNGVFDPAHPDQNVTTTYGYDALGRRIWARDTLGHYDTTHYNAAGQTDWTERDVSSLQLDAQSQPVYQPFTPAAPDQNVATLYGYDGMGRQVLVTQTGILTGPIALTAGTLAFGLTATRVTRTDYDSLGHPVTTTLNYQPGQAVNTIPDVNVQTVRQYDNAGNLTGQRDALGRWTVTGYDNNNRPVTTTVNYVTGNPLTGGGDTDLVNLTTYNADGSVASATDNYVPGTAFAASAPITDRVTTYGYDALGRPVTTTVNADANPADAGRTDVNRASLTAYDPATGRTLGQRDALGRWTATRYDALGRPSATVRDCVSGGAPAATCDATTGAGYNVATQTRYDALGRAFETVDPFGAVAHTDYNGLGQPLVTTQGYASGAAPGADTNVAARTAYDGLGRAITTTDALSNATAYGYDGLGRTVAVTDALGRVTTTGYDGTGATRWRRAPDGRYTVYGLDGLGRVAQTTQNYTTTAAAGATDANLTTGTRYDLAGRTVTTIDPAGRVVSTTYDLRDRVVAQTRNAVAAGQSCLAPPCNVTTTAQYDRAGDRIASADALGNVTSYAYDAAGAVTATVDALGGVLTTQYDAGGRVAVETDQVGRQAVSSYDGLDEVVARTVGITSGSPGVAPSVGATTVYTYSAGVRTDQQGPDGVDTHSGYDALGRAVTTTVGFGTSLARTSLMGYDPAGRVVTATAGYGTSLRRDDVTVYNADGTVAATLANDRPGAQATADTNVAASDGYDAAGRRTLAVDALGHATLTRYDGLGRPAYTLRNPSAPVSYDSTGSPVTPATPPAFSPQHPDQNVATLYAYDQLGQQTIVTATGIVTGTFDPASRTFSAATTRASYTQYDGLERPVTTTLNWRPDVTAPRADTNVQSVAQYDAAGNPIGRRDALARWTVTGYDPLNRPVTTTVNYEDGNPTTVAPQNQSWTDGSDTDLVGVTRYNADSTLSATIANVVTGTTGTTGQPVPFAASAPITDRVTAYQYDGQGQPVTTTANLNPGGASADTNRVGVTAYVGTSDRVAGQRDALGRWTAAAYDALGQRTAVVRDCASGAGTPLNPAAGACAPFAPSAPDRNVPTAYGYDALGRTTAVTDALGHATATQYDGRDRALSVTRNAVPGAPAASDTNVTTRYQYDAAGHTTSATNPVSGTTSYTYDALGRTTATTDTLGRAIPTGQGGGGARWSVTPDGRYTVQQVDGLGRVVTTTQNYSPTAPLAATDATLITATVYDAAGRVTQLTDPAGRVTQYGYDLRDHLTRVVRNARAACPAAATDCAATTTYTYDRAGHRVAATDPTGHTRRYSYDAADEQTAASDALGRTTTRAYDAGGRVTTQRDPRGSAYDLQYGYDTLDRVTRAAPASAPSTTLAPIATSYDALGRRTTLSDGTGATSYQYDALNRTVAVSAPNTGQVGYGYDAAGRRTQTIYPDGTALSYSYRADNQLQQVTQAGAPQAAPPLASYGYDQAGRLTSLARGNGATTTYGYDGADRLLRARTTTADGTPQSLYLRTVDILGQTTVLTETTKLTPLPNGGVPAGNGGMASMSMGASSASSASTSAAGAGTLADPWAAPLNAPAPASSQTAAQRTTTATTTTAATTTGAPPAIPANPDTAVTTPATRRHATGHASTRTAGPALRARATHLGLRFEANRGQTARGVRYLARGTGYTVYLSGTDATIAVTARTMETA